jgi:alkaline phosphatase D
VTSDALRCEFRATAHPVAADAVFGVQAQFRVAADNVGVDLD